MNHKSLKATALGICAMASAFASAQVVQVSVNGNPVSFPDSQPQMMNGRVMVPLRGVFEAIGATVLWDPSTQSIAASEGRRRVRLKIGVLEANVDGRIVSMDTAPLISGGSTLVPLRFLGQSLGAKVDWEPQQNLVALTTRDEDHAQRFDRPTPPPPPTIIVNNPPPNPGWNRPPQPPRRDDRFVLASYSVIPLRLDTTLSSDGNRDGDTFSATVRGDRDSYLEFPRGTVVEGYVRKARRADGDRSGQLDVRFTDILLPSGKRYRINGTVAQLNDPNIYRGPDGRFIAKNNDDVKNNVGRDAAIGAGAGLVIGSMHARALGGAAVGGVLGAIVGALTPEHRDRNVRIDQGTKLGLILNQNLVIDRRDLR